MLCKTKNLILLLTLVLFANVVYADLPVFFVDKNLETAVRLELGIPEPDPIYPSDMLLLTQLTAQARDIVYLTGLEYATNLTTLSLGANQISDLEPISGLTSLEDLWLQLNQISDISPLSGLTSLVVLSLYSNDISNLEPISGLTSLRFLFTYNNDITEIPDFSDLTSLIEIFLDNNRISDISGLCGLASVTRLGLGDNHITGLPDLSGLTNLRQLYLYENDISDISPLTSLTNLETLWMWSNPLDCPAYDIYIPLIELNNPGIDITYDPRPVECTEFQVNTHTADSQENPSVAMDADGDFVITWESRYQDGDGWGIYAQRYNSNGTAEGGEFLVNTYTTNSQVNPSVAMDDDGNFVIAWQSSDGDGYGIYAQRYNSDGTTAVDEFQVNTETANNQTNPSVAMDADGDFVIAWQGLFGISPYEYSIRAQRFDSNGTPAEEDEFQVNIDTKGFLKNASVAMNTDGDFVIAWERLKFLGDESAVYDIFARMFDNNGTAADTVLNIDHNTHPVLYPSVAMDADGNFVITWEKWNEIYARMVDSDGMSPGLPFLVGTGTNNSQENPSVAMDADGDFVITWQSVPLFEDDWGIYAQWYNSNGTPAGPEYPVKAITGSPQVAPSVAMDDNGNSVIAWEGRDESYDGIFARMFSAPSSVSVEEICLVLDDASNVISGLIIDEPEVFMNNLVMYRLEATIEEVLVLLLPRADVSPYEEALKTLEKKVITKMDGCAVSGTPDTGDWIITCEAQDQVYPHIAEAIELLKEIVE